MKKSGIQYVCAAVMVVSIILTGIACGADVAAMNQEEAIVCLAEETENAKGDIILTQAEKSLLAQLVSAECAGEPYLCRVAAAAVVLNRVKHEGFPDTVVNVIFSVGAFPSVEEGRIGQGAVWQDVSISMQAVRQAASGEDPTGGALYFAREDDPLAAGIGVTFFAGDMVFGR